MAEETVTTDTDTTAADDKPDEEQRVPYERFQKANQKAKDAADKATKLEKDLADLRAQLDEREAAGLPELERERKRAEQLEKRAADAERLAEEAQTAQARSKRERVVLAAAARANFEDPDDVLRYPEYVDLDQIEDADQADRALKRLAKAKPRLLKPDDNDRPQIGRLLENGQPAAKKDRPQGAIDVGSEAEMLAEALKQFVRE